MKLPFEVGKYYTALQSDKDRQFVIGEKYKCVEINNADGFNPKLKDDQSTLKILNPNGVKMGYFGCIAIQYFSDSPSVISKHYSDTTSLYQELIFSSTKKIEDNINSIQSELNQLIGFSKLLNGIKKSSDDLGINYKSLHIDENLLKEQSILLDSLKKSLIESYKPIVPSNLEMYLRTKNGKKLLEENTLDDYCVWCVYGENRFWSERPNLIGYYQGKLEDVLTKMLTMESFWKYKIGGIIYKYKSPEIINISNV